MSAQDPKSAQEGSDSPAPVYDKLCCLFLGWDDGINDKTEQV
jgi:hypothetical protein